MLADEVVGNDFFLSEFKDEFLDNLRHWLARRISDSSNDRYCEFAPEVESFAGGRREMDY